MNTNIGKYILIDIYVFILFVICLSPMIISLRYLPTTYYFNILVGGIWSFFFIFFLSKKLYKFESNYLKDKDLDPTKKISTVFYIMISYLSIYFLFNQLYIYSFCCFALIIFMIFRDFKRWKKPKNSEKKGDEIYIS